jgi:hypothetical protein
MSSLPVPRYGLLVVVSYSSLCQVPLYSVTVLIVLCPDDARGWNSRMLYPHLFC